MTKTLHQYKINKVTVTECWDMYTIGRTNDKTLHQYKINKVTGVHVYYR